MDAPIPADEAQRLADLEKLQFTNTAASESWNRIARLASFVCETPIALVGVIDENRHWFKATVGTDLQENTRENAVCAHALASDDLLEIEDLRADARFHENPFVANEPHLRFYAGAPVHSPWGRRLGTVCVYDIKPKKLSPEQRQAMQDLAAQADELFVLRSAGLELGLASHDEIKSVHAKAQSVINEMRHDLVTPLTPAIMYADLLRKEVATNARASGYADKLSRNLERLQHAIEMASQALRGA